MSASAGKVLIIPKGAWDSATQYEMLNAVSYNNRLFIAKRANTNVTPVDGADWMLCIQGSSIALDDVTDVDITSAQNGQALVYDSANSKWVNGDVASSVSSLTDVNLTSLQNGQILKYNSVSGKWENATMSSGILPHIIVISESGSTVSAVKGGTTIDFTETSSGHFEGDVTEFGTWTIHAVLSGDDATVSLVVDTVKVYTVDDSHFHADITAYYPKDAGATCALSASGQATQYATTNPYVFTVHEAGTYTLTVTYDGQTYTDTVSVSETGQAFTKTVPSALNAPTNDYQMWLFFGGIDNSESTYTSLADILADSSALATLMSTNNAVDYLVRCEEWAGVGLVPTMTSATTPSGVASANAESSSHPAWHAFRNNPTSEDGYSSGSSSAGWLQYEFTTAQIVVKMAMRAVYQTEARMGTFRVKGSNDGSNWSESLYSGTWSGTSVQTFNLTNSTAYKYYRVEWDSYSAYVCVAYLQFFSSTDATDITANQSVMNAIGSSDYASNTLTSDSDWCTAIANSTYRESILNVKVPTMTSNTTPSGEASASGVYSSTYPAWNAFDGIYPPATATAWVSPATNDTVWIKYRFSGKQVRICSMMVYPVAAPNTLRVKTFTLKGSNDDSAYTELFTHQFPQDNTLVKENYFGFVQANSYEYFKAELPDFWNSNQRGFIELQLYGRENGGVQDWLRAGGIDKDYLTLAEVLADSTTLSALMASQSAVNYLVTCKSWATTICANQSAMQYIGLNNYCANTLLADSDWLNAIANSTYMESVLNVKVPTMTSATTPSGECFASSTASGYPYLCFDGTTSTTWISSTESNPFIGYGFESAKVIKAVQLKFRSVASSNNVNISIQASNNLPTYEEIGTGVVKYMESLGYQMVPIENFTAHTYHKVVFGSPLYVSGSYNAYIEEVQFYGREDV